MLRNFIFAQVTILTSPINIAIKLKAIFLGTWTTVTNQDFSQADFTELTGFTQLYSFKNSRTDIRGLVI